MVFGTPEIHLSGESGVSCISLARGNECAVLLLSGIGEVGIELLVGTSHCRVVVISGHFGSGSIVKVLVGVLVGRRGVAHGLTIVLTGIVI